MNAAVALRFAPPFRCHRELGPGEVKRIAVGGRLVGYYLRCPACRALLQVLADAVEETGPLVEQAAGPGLGARVRRPSALATRAAAPCACGRSVVVRDEQVGLAP